MKFLKHLQWRIEYIGYRAVEWLVSRLSPEEADGVGQVLGRIAHRILPSRRIIVLRNLRIVLAGKQSPAAIAELGKEVFARAGANLIGSLRSADIGPEELDRRMTVIGLDEFQRLEHPERGAIIVVPHMGNWEILSQLIRIFPEGTRISTHYRKLNNPLLNARIEAQRSRHGTGLFSKGTSSHAMVNLLREGGVLGILADQRAGRAGYWCSYHGRFTTCASLPEILSRRTGALIVNLSVRTTAPAHWEVICERLERNDTPFVMRAVERATLRSIPDVFWLQDRWRLRRSNPFGIEGKRHPKADPSQSTKPARILLWLPSADAPLPARPEVLRPDLRLEVVVGGTAPAAPWPDQPWSKVWLLDPTLPPEHHESFLRDIDAAEPLPIDAVVLAAELPSVCKAARRLGIPCRILPPGTG